MKKLALLPFAVAVLVLAFACAKEELKPDPPAEVIVPEPVVDTSRHQLINDWTCYQYKYTHDNKMWIMQTAWAVKITKDSIKIDEGRDGDFEKKYRITISAVNNASIVTISYPQETKAYEVRPTRIDKKQGYDLINDNGLAPDVYSLIK